MEQILGKTLAWWRRSPASTIGRWEWHGEIVMPAAGKQRESSLLLPRCGSVPKGFGKRRPIGAPSGLFWMVRAARGGAIQA